MRSGPLLHGRGEARQLLLEEGRAAPDVGEVVRVLAEERQVAERALVRAAGGHGVYMILAREKKFQRAGNTDLKTS